MSKTALFEETPYSNILYTFSLMTSAEAADFLQKYMERFCPQPPARKAGSKRILGLSSFSFHADSFLREEGEL